MLLGLGRAGRAKICRLVAIDVGARVVAWSALYSPCGAAEETGMQDFNPRFTGQTAKNADNFNKLPVHHPFRRW